MAYTILIVDDSNIIRNKIQRNLADSDFHVVATADNGIDALRQFKKFHPQVITMDLTMPRMDGLQCIKSIIKEAPDTLILVISALSDKATGIRALELGASGFIYKPFNDEDLITALYELVADDEYDN